MSGVHDDDSQHPQGNNDGASLPTLSPLMPEAIASGVDQTSSLTLAAIAADAQDAPMQHLSETLDNSSSNSNSSPFFSRTFSDMSLFDLASSLLADKVSLSPQRDGDDASGSQATTGASCPWRNNSPPRPSRTAAGPAAVIGPGDGAMESDRASPSRPEISRHLDEALESLIRDVTSPPAQRKKRRNEPLPSHVAPVLSSLATSDSVEIPAGVTVAATSPRASPHEMTLYELFEVAGESPQEAGSNTSQPRGESHNNRHSHETTAASAPPSTLTVPQPALPPAARRAPHRVACLFVEVLAEDVAQTSGAQAPVRQLLSQWCGLALTPRGDSDDGSSCAWPPPDQRLVLFLAPNADALRRALLSWTLQPFAENATMMPLFGCCFGGAPDEAAELTSPVRKSPLKGSAKGKTTAGSKEARSRRVVTFADPVETVAGASANTLDLAVHDAIDMLHIDVKHSVCWGQTAAVRRALCRAGLSERSVLSTLDATMRRVHAKAVAARDEPEKKAHKTSRKRAREGCEPFDVSWSVAALGRGIDEARRLAFWRLASWNRLARLVWQTPRRPALLLRHVRVHSAPPRSWVYGVVCPALSHEDTLPLTTATRSLRARLAEAPAQRITWMQRAMVIGFGTFLFGTATFRTAISVLRAYGEEVESVPNETIAQRPAASARRSRANTPKGYVKGFCCVCTGYQRYRVASTLRRYVHTTLDLHLAELWEGSSGQTGMEGTVSDVFECFFPSFSGLSELTVPEGPWRRVLPRFSCSCVPRSFERVRVTDKGAKLCRHVAQLLLYTLQRQCVVVPAEHDEADVTTWPAQDATTSGIPSVDQLIADSTRPVRVDGAFEPDDGLPPPTLAAPRSMSTESAPRPKSKAKPKSPAPQGASQTPPITPQVGESGEEQVGASATRRRHRHHHPREDDGEGEGTDKNEPKKMKKHEKQSKSLSSPSSTPLSSSAGHDQDNNGADASFHRRALDYSLALIRARAAELIQSQIPLASANSVGADSVATSQGNAAASAALSDVGTLAWLQALLEAPHPPSSSQTPPQ